MKLTCPRCGAQGIAVSWRDCLSNASRVVPRRCAACNGSAKRHWFSWQSFVAGVPALLGVVPLLLGVPGFLPMVSLSAGLLLSWLLRGFSDPFFPWPTPIVVPPVIIPPEEDCW
jgi:hypothetical protein